ncbi:MAG TPA: asparaginase [Candidatus Limnocylindria bacterium]|nr:asparaginase [Candidatus Limnocylindria bacterium]
MDLPVVAEVVRSGFVEGAHRGSVVALAADGDVLFSVGRPEEPIFPRSSNKPLQTIGMLRAGLELDGPLLALSSASHSGEDFHLDGVRQILAGAGLDVDALQTPPDLPYGESPRAAWIRTVRAPEPLAMNCSGKHAAMLATCVVNGWDLLTYRDPAHPLQRLLRDTVADLAGEPVTVTGIDGCGAPVFGLSLTGLARSFRAWVLGDEGTAERRTYDAVRAFPEWLGGTDRDVTDLIRGVPGLVAKDGAEAVYAVALADGRSVALKIEDGGQRARPPVMAAALAALGVEAPVLAEQADWPILGGGVRVGRVRAVRTLFPA